MSLHHLDPRQAGTGAAPDVRIRYARVRGDWRAVGARTGRALALAAPTEAAALAAARHAAGFGHVAEQVCDQYYAPGYPDTKPNGDPIDCATCTWPFDAHKEGSK